MRKSWVLKMTHLDAWHDPSRCVTCHVDYIWRLCEYKQGSTHTRSLHVRVCTYTVRVRMHMHIHVLTSRASVAQLVRARDCQSHIAFHMFVQLRPIFCSFPLQQIATNKKCLDGSWSSTCSTIWLAHDIYQMGDEPFWPPCSLTALSPSPLPDLTLQHTPLLSNTQTPSLQHTPLRKLTTQIYQDSSLLSALHVTQFVGYAQIP